MEKEITIASKDGSEANATDYKSMYEQLQSEFTRIKSANDKLSSENADYKRSERERMTEEQKRNADIAEKEKSVSENDEKSLIKTALNVVFLFSLRSGVGCVKALTLCDAVIGTAFISLSL